MMREERITKSGHLQIVTNIISDLNNLCIELISEPEQIEFHKFYTEAISALEEYRSVTKENFPNIVYSGLAALNSLFLMRLQKKEISTQTNKSFTSITKFIALLSKKYKEKQENPEM